MNTHLVHRYTVRIIRHDLYAEHFRERGGEFATCALIAEHGCAGHNSREHPGQRPPALGTRCRRVPSSPRFRGILLPGETLHKGKRSSRTYAPGRARRPHVSPDRDTRRPRISRQERAERRVASQSKTVVPPFPRPQGSETPLPRRPACWT